MNIKRKIIFIVMLFLCFYTYNVFAENGSYYLDNGVALFRIGEYAKSIDNFKKVIINQDSKNFHADAYFWISKAYIATDRLNEAEKTLEYFLLNYTDSNYYEEAVYQKGRLLFLQRDYENCILDCKNFIEQYPGSIFLPNTYYWLGETLYSLGRLDESEKIFHLIVEKYPSSFKVKDSRNRLQLIEQKYREESLIKLLKLTHEDYYRAIEELELREKTYETAIDSYQKKLMESNTVNNVQAVSQENSSEKEIIDLKNEIGEKNVEIAALKRKISEMEYRLEDYNDEIPPSPASKFVDPQANKVLSPDGENELNELKNRAEQVRDYYLKYLDNNGE